MPTTVLATALPYSLADGAGFQLTVFLTHKLEAEPPPVGEPAREFTLADFPAARDWITTLERCSFSLITSLGGGPIPLTVVSEPDPRADSWAAVLPSDVPVVAFPKPKLSEEAWHTNPAHRLSDHAIDLHVAAMVAAPGPRPGALDNPVATSLLDELGELDPDGPWREIRRRGEDDDRLGRQYQVLAQRISDALATLGPLTGTGDDPLYGDLRPQIPVTRRWQLTDRPSPVQLLLDDPESDLRITRALDALIGQDLSDRPQLQMLVDAHALRRYYERPEQPQQEPQRLPDPDAPPTPRPDRPVRDFHARVAAFGSTPALLRRLGLAVDVVLKDMDAAQARAALAGAQWISVKVTGPSDVPDLAVLPSHRTAVTVDGDLFTARSSSGLWTGGALPLADDDWVVLDLDPDASGLKIDQFTRNLIRQYAAEANGDPGTSAPGTLRSTGFAIARRDREAWLRERLTTAETIESRSPETELQYDDLVRGIRVEVWDDRTRQWHSLHRRTVTVTGEPETAEGARTEVLTNTQDVGFLQLSALNRAPGDTANGYYLHEVVAGWDGWSLSAPRPGLTIADIEPPDDPDDQIRGAHIISRVAPGSLPSLRYGTSYAFRILGVDLAGNSVPQVPGTGPFLPEENAALIAAAGERLDQMQEASVERDVQRTAGQQEEILEYLRSRERATRSPAVGLPEEHATKDKRLDEELDHALRLAGSLRNEDLPQDAREGEAAGPALFGNLMTASMTLASALPSWRVRPQLATGPETLAQAAACADLRLPAGLGLRAVTVPQPYLRWEPVPAPALVARHELGTGEQLARLVIRSGPGSGGWAVPDKRPTAERHLVPPKSTQLEAETAGEFDDAIGTKNTAEIKRLYPIALAERGTLFDLRRPSQEDALETVAQPGISLAARPGADTGSDHWATLEDIAKERGRQIGEGQYVVHDVDELHLPYLPDPCAAGVSLVFYRASGAPHRLPDRRALQAVSVPYPEGWPVLGPLRLVLESGTTLGARVIGRAVHVSVPPGEQVHVALSSTLDPKDLALFGLWRSHPASAVGPDEGWPYDQRAAAETLKRAAVSGWTWWLTPSTDLRLVHAVPAPVRPPQLSALRVEERPPGTAQAALRGVVDLHGASTGTLVVQATWTEWVDDVSELGPRRVTKNDIVVESPVGEAETTGALYLCDYLEWVVPFADSESRNPIGTVGLHRAIQTFPDTHYRRVTYVPSGRTRYAEFFEPAYLPDPNNPKSAPLLDGEPVVLNVPSSTRPAAPVVLDTVPLLRWEEAVEPAEPFAWRRVRRSGVRVWLARPWYSSGDDELLGVIVTGRQRGVPDVPDAATSLWGADPIQYDSGKPSSATALPLLGARQILLKALRVKPGSAERSVQTPGRPVTFTPDLPLLDVVDRPKAAVFGYPPEYDEASKRWFADIVLEDTVTLWPFVRLAVARYQPNSITDCELSSIALTGWVQPLPTRTLTVSRPDARHVKVTLSGVVSWLRPQDETPPPQGEPNADTPFGDDAVHAARLRRSRTVHATIQHRPAGSGDLAWEKYAHAELPAVLVEESGAFRATWTGALALPPTPAELGAPGLRTPGSASPETEPLWRILVEEHELLNADDPDPATEMSTTVPRLIYADVVTL